MVKQTKSETGVSSITVLSMFHATARWILKLDQGKGNQDVFIVDWGGGKKIKNDIDDI